MTKRIVGIEDLSWMSNAKCAGKTDLFFGPGAKESVRDRRERERAAIAICLTCPSLVECKNYARKTGELGIWGAETEDQRYQAGFLRDPSTSRRNKARRDRAEKRMQSQQQC